MSRHVIELIFPLVIIGNSLHVLSDDVKKLITFFSFQMQLPTRVVHLCGQLHNNGHLWHHLLFGDDRRWLLHRGLPSIRRIPKLASAARGEARARENREGGEEKRRKRGTQESRRTQGAGQEGQGGNSFAKEAGQARRAAAATSACARDGVDASCTSIFAKMSTFGHVRDCHRVKQRQTWQLTYDHGLMTIWQDNWPMTID